MKAKEELTETILKPRDNLRLFLHKKFYYSLVYQKALNELRHPIADIIFDQIAVSIYWEVKNEV